MHPTPGKLAQDGINDYNLLKATQGNFHSIITFPAFSLLIIFIFLKFTLNPFNPHAHFLAPSLPFRPSNFSLTNAKSSAQSSSSGNFDLTFVDSASKTMINIEPLCHPTWTRKSSANHCTSSTNYSSRTGFRKAHHATSTGTLSKAFSKSTNAMNKLFFFTK